MENPSFLKKKYGELHTAPDVKAAAKRAEAKTGQKVSEKPEALIQNYLNRFKEIVERKKPEEREHGLDAIKRMLYRAAVIKPEDIPESYWETQRRLARELGHGDIEITDDMRSQQAEIIITDQKSSLDTWVDYLASPDATYPDWLKYWSIRSVLGMGEYDKEKKVFTKRTKGTVKPFPDLNREALAYVLDAVEKKTKGIGKTEKGFIGPLTAFETFLQEESFPKLYAWAIDKVTPASKEFLTNTQGEWVKYPKGSDHTPLVESLQSHGTGWCTAGESTAKTQLQGGDFYVYYSLDAQGQPTIPRAAIRMQENSIAEVRGIADNQNLDPYIGNVVQDKMKEFPDGKAYEKKAGDMKKLTALENKIKLGADLIKDDLIFLYEINAPVEGFGYQRDPRIEELRKQRDPKADAPIVFECAPNEIAWNKKEINENIKAYVGPLFKDIFETLGHLDHIYTAFPEGKIRREAITIGGKDAKQLETELKKAGFNISDHAKFMMNSKDFVAQKKSEEADLVRLTVRDLGFTNNATTDEIYKKAKELGLELCPAEVGPHYRLAYTNQPMNEYLLVAMKQISGPDGLPFVFRLWRAADGVWLEDRWARPARQWHSERQFVFRLSSSRK